MARELEVLFNSKAMPKILNLFFQNEERGFRVKEVAKRCQIHSKTVKKELEKQHMQSSYKTTIIKEILQISGLFAKPNIKNLLP